MEPRGEEVKEDAKTRHLRQAVVWLLMRWLDSIVSSCCYYGGGAPRAGSHEVDHLDIKKKTEKEEEEHEKKKMERGVGIDRKSCDGRVKGGRGIEEEEQGYDESADETRKRIERLRREGGPTDGGEELQQLLRLFETFANCM